MTPRHGKHVHRSLKVGNKGADVRELQQGLNALFDHYKIDYHVHVDGSYGHHTKKSTLLGEYIVGLSKAVRHQTRHKSLSTKAQRVIRNPKERTTAMAIRRAHRRKHIKRLRHQAAKNRPSGAALERVDVVTSQGDPHWGGGNDVIRQFVSPFLAEKFGLSEGSGKRTPAENAAVGGSPTSDHLTTHTTTMARDYPTFSGAGAARALAAAMGYSGWSENSYTSFNCSVDGHTFRVQILWGAAIGHSDHVHVGVGLVG